VLPNFKKSATTLPLRNEGAIVNALSALSAERWSRDVETPAMSMNTDGTDKLCFRV
jgi:hypothetical protein